MRPRICRPRKRSLQRRLSTTPALSRRLPRSDRECASLLLAWPALLLVRRRLAWPWLLLVRLCLASWARLGWRLGLAWVAWRASGRAPRVPRASRRPRVSASVGSIANVAKAASPADRSHIPAVPFHRRHGKPRPLTGAPKPERFCYTHKIGRPPKTTSWSRSVRAREAPRLRSSRQQSATRKRSLLFLLVPSFLPMFCA